MLNGVLRWAMDINAARGRIPRGLAEPTWPAARDDSDLRSFVRARSSVSVTRPLDRFLAPRIRENSRSVSNHHYEHPA